MTESALKNQTDQRQSVYIDTMVWIDLLEASETTRTSVVHNLKTNYHVIPSYDVVCELFIPEERTAALSAMQLISGFIASDGMLPGACMMKRLECQRALYGIPPYEVMTPKSALGVLADMVEGGESLRSTFREAAKDRKQGFRASMKAFLKLDSEVPDGTPDFCWPWSQPQFVSKMLQSQHYVEIMGRRLPKHEVKMLISAKSALQHLRMTMLWFAAYTYAIVKDIKEVERGDQFDSDHLVSALPVDLLVTKDRSFLAVTRLIQDLIHPRVIYAGDLLPELYPAGPASE